MLKHDIIVVGTSAGGVEALVALVHELPADFAGAIFIVLHIPTESSSLLPEILSRAGPLPVSQPAHGTPIEYGHIYVAPPDYHMLIGQDKVQLMHGPRENRHRPAIDPLFRSAAIAYGPRVVGVVLTGMLNDGTAGLLAIKRSGGITIVQDPAEAVYPDMPNSALQHVQVDHCLSLSAIGELLTKLTHEPIADGVQAIPADVLEEVEAVKMDVPLVGERASVGKPSNFSCPECGGVLWEIQDGTFLRFRCRVGHAFSAENVLLEQEEFIEKALWSVSKALEEKSSLSRRMAQHARENQQYRLALSLETSVQQVEDDALVVLQLLSHPTFKQKSTENPQNRR